MTTQPVVTAQDAFGNRDVHFSEIISLTEASAGTLSGTRDVAAIAGVASFGDLVYTATADQQSFVLTADDQSGLGSDLPTVNANAVLSDVVATALLFSVQPAPLTLEHGATTALTTVPVVTAVDANLVTDTGYATSITLSEVNGAGTAALTAVGDQDGSGATVTLAPSSGQATFTGMSVTYTPVATAAETFNLRATSGALTPANSSQLTSSDTTPPTVASVSVPANASYGLGQTLNFTVNTSEPILVNTGGGTPRIALTIGSTLRWAGYVSGSGSTALVFRYTVQAGDADADGIAIGTLDANGGTMRDGAGNDLVPTLNAVGNTTAVLVNTTNPSVSILNAPAIVNANTPFNVTFAFSADVTGFAVGDISVANGAASNFVVSNASTYTADITPSGAGDITIAIAANVAQDGSGNGNTAAVPSIVVYDANAPTLASAIPADDATAVAVGADIVLTFSENIQAGAGNITISDGAGDTRTIPVGDPQITIAGATLTINPSADLRELTGYHLQIAATAVRDAAGNAYVGISDTTTLNFTTADTTAPLLVSSNPADNATAVPLASNIVLTFSENVQAGTGSIVISDGAGDTRSIPVGDAQITIAGNVVTIDPATDLNQSTGYNVQIAATAFLDGAGNAYAGIATTTELNFATLDTAAPTATFSPADEATDVAVDATITITFNEAIRRTDDVALTDANVDALITLKDTDANGANIAFDATIAGNVISVRPAVDLDAAQQVFVALGADVEDMSDNAFAGGDATFAVVITLDTPATAFAETEAAVRDIVRDDMMRSLQSSLTSSRRMISEARNRLIAYDQGQRTVGPVVTPLRFDGVARADLLNASTRGTASASALRDDGAAGRFFFGDFDIHYDLVTYDATATLSARMAWERIVADGTLVGYFIGTDLSESNVNGTLAGDQTRLGLSAGGYVAQRLADQLYMDAYVAVGLGQSALDLDNGTLALRSTYQSETVMAGAALAGTYQFDTHEFRPELSFNYARAAIGAVTFTGQAYGLVDDTLGLNAGAVTFANLTLRPEVIYTLAQGGFANTSATLSFSPRLICERMIASRRSESCGSGGEVGYTALSRDGMQAIGFRFAADRVGSMRRSTAVFGVEMQF